MRPCPLTANNSNNNKTAKVVRLPQIFPQVRPSVPCFPLELSYKLHVGGRQASLHASFEGGQDRPSPSLPSPPLRPPSGPDNTLPSPALQTTQNLPMTSLAPPPFLTTNRQICLLHFHSRHLPSTHACSSLVSRLPPSSFPRTSLAYVLFSARSNSTAAAAGESTAASD